MLKTAKNLIAGEDGAVDVSAGLYCAVAMTLVFSVVHMLLGN